MLDPSGVWAVTYRATADAGAASPDDEEIATLILKEDGTLGGHDPFGGKYSGTYSVEGNSLRASVVVENNYDEAVTVFRDFDFPLTVELEGNYTSPDYFTANCSVNGQAVLLISGRRIGDPV